ncbi:E3 ubiquitin-protein ligase SH3RF3-like isoform X2 [Mytilus californianus]|uniref:E3 ubiquitin-protein ligase SH3RF3-like isoform X2 n=1 Tax=Mytilus californianus TaxID=6549 RepID=UPI0022462325|nr:E3 ubiquitin-protein ligase SH3RF3-like isoform X2 [Mytilus californianus]
MDEQSLNELLECSVCLDRLDHTSKVLPCQHTFCRRCLEEIVSTKGELRCPECRYLVEIRVEELPSNILLIRLLEGIKTKTCTERSRSPGRYTNDELSSGSATDRHSKQSVGKLPCAKALYNYEGKDSNDLSFRKGDIIILKKQVDDNWYHGEFNSHHGFFPASYVQVLVQLTSNVPQCKTLYDFEMKDESDKKDCLFFKKDETITVLKKVDDNWLEGRKGEKIGIFPVSFVEMNDAARSLINSQSKSLELSSSGNLVIVPSPHLPSRSRSPPPVPSHNSQSATSANKTTSVLASKSSVASRNSSLTASKTSSATGSKLNSAFQEPGTSRKFDNSMEPQTGPAIVDASKISGINSPVYTALFNYKPHREDEIELRKGDYYTVCDKCQDGWYRGQCLKTGKPGVFPGNYVQMVRLPSAFLPVSGNVMNIHSKGIHSLPSSSSAPAVTMTTSSGHRSSTSPIRPGSSPSLQNSSSQQAESSSGPPPITPRSSKSLAKLSSSAPSRSAANSKTSSHSSASNKSSATKLTNSGPSSPRSASSRTSSSSSLKPADSSGTKAKSPHRHANHNGPSVGMEGHLDLSVTSGHSNHRTSSSKQVVYRKPNAVGMPQVMSASSNITPPNIVAGATGEIPGIKDNKKDKKEKEKLSLVKRLTSGKSKKSKSPGLESDGSGTESIGNHVRSGSCPADSNSLLGAEGSQHMKTGSFDSTVPLVPQQKISRPKPVVREKYRCVVPYPPQSDVELELKVGDVVYVHKKREDGWYKGTLQRLGKTGLFPGSFVEKCENV